jgi:hypothetical protein
MLYQQIMQRMKAINPRVSSEEIAAEISKVLTLEWKVGFHDRGLGRGDYAVIAAEDLVVVECPDHNFAQHICEVHNKSLKTKKTPAMTEHDRIRKERAEACDRNSMPSLLDALRGLQSTDDPSLVALHDDLMARYLQLESQEKAQKPS